MKTKKIKTTKHRHRAAIREALELYDLKEIKTRSSATTAEITITITYK